jgi:hypothetical protein
MLPNIKIVQTRLDAIRYVISRHLAEREMFFSGHVDDVSYVDMEARHIVMQLEATFYGSRPDRYEERMDVPADWWSHFKVWALARNAWWTRWVRRLSKPSMRTLVFSAEGRLLFPDIPFTTRERHHTIVVADTHLDWAK